MRPVSPPAAPQTVEPAREPGAQTSAEWAERAGRLFTELERPARAMVRRAYHGAFTDEEVDDIYSSAWVGTLRTLARRHAQLSDEEIRRYLLTAVANQASKEVRRRKRKPTAPLELVGPVADDAGTPDERVVGAERSGIARDLLTSLPPRRRAVMLLRYGWGLEPRQVCELVGGLSPRAYRKEITRGVDELTERMRRLERGEWCAEREPLLKAYAAGLADADERRQARAHLSHCHDCSDFVARLGGHLHDMGAALTVPGALDALDGEMSLTERIGDVADRGREALGGLLSRGGAEGVQEAAGGLAAAGGTRGTAGAAGAAGAGILTKLTGIGAAGKIAVACLTGGAVATACLSAGVVPGLGPPGAGGDRERSSAHEMGGRTTKPKEIRTPDELVAKLRPAAEEPPSRGPTDPPAEESAPEPAPPPPVEPVAPGTPPVAQEFGVAGAASPAGGGGSSAGSGGGGSSAGSGGGGGGGGGGSAVRREFGP